MKDYLVFLREMVAERPGFVPRDLTTWCTAFTKAVQ
jgi:hypothetical protein